MMVLQGIDQKTIKEYNIEFGVSGDNFIVYIGEQYLTGIFDPIITYNNDLQIYYIKSETACISIYKGLNTIITVIYP